MAYASYKVTVPGSLMLCGEHAVLRQKLAIVVAINHYIKINLTPHTATDRQIKIISKKFGNYSTTIDKYKIAPPYNYVLTAIKQQLTKIPSGFTLNIYADFPADIGFGSSAAVTVATLGALFLWLNRKKTFSYQNKIYLYQQAKRIIRQVQGLGSGADIAASIFGGIIAYKMRPLVIKKINNNSLPLVAIYSGKKIATAQVVAQVTQAQKYAPQIFPILYQGISACTKTAISALKNKQLPLLGRLMNIHHGLQDALGTSDATLSELLYNLRAKNNIYGAKISGAGLGDCVVGLGKIKNNTFPENIAQKKAGVRQIKIAVSKTGLLAI